jgi:thiamine phosphate synthase YjbQ (UPF0047 family)
MIFYILSFNNGLLNSTIKYTGKGTMHAIPLELSLEVDPRRRFEITDVTKKIFENIRFDPHAYQKATYCSLHTTAGYLDQQICARLRYSQDRIEKYIHSFMQLFPFMADYRHDQISLRNELTEEQKRKEPRNADSHLTFIGSGLKNCVTYLNKPEIPVYFIDLDGVHEFGYRKRLTNVMLFNNEDVVYRQTVEIPMSRHPVDSVNLRNPKLGYLDKLNHLLEKFEIRKGRIDISLDPSEKHAGLTVNEFETLLMTHDLVEVLRNPLKYVGEKGRYILQHPEKLASRSREYAKYDLVQLFNEIMDKFHISQSILEKVLSKFLALPAERFLQVRRNISLLFSNQIDGAPARIVEGTYQSPILVQWKEAPRRLRRLRLTITRYH